MEAGFSDDENEKNFGEELLGEKKARQCESIYVKIK